MFQVFQKTSTILLPSDFVRDLASLLFQFTKGPASPRFHLRSSRLHEAFLFKRKFDPKVRPKIRKGSLKGIFAIDICHCDPEVQGVRCNLSRINTCWVLHDQFFFTAGMKIILHAKSTTGTTTITPRTFTQCTASMLQLRCRCVLQ